VANDEKIENKKPQTTAKMQEAGNPNRNHDLRQHHADNPQARAAAAEAQRIRRADPEVRDRENAMRRACRQRRLDQAAPPPQLLAWAASWAGGRVNSPVSGLKPI
jgi:hypothetical protein